MAIYYRQEGEQRQYQRVFQGRNRTELAYQITLCRAVNPIANFQHIYLVSFSTLKNGYE